jgi:hypothetical protein
VAKAADDKAQGKIDMLEQQVTHTNTNTHTHTYTLALPPQVTELKSTILRLSDQHQQVTP